MKKTELHHHPAALHRRKSIHGGLKTSPKRKISIWNFLLLAIVLIIVSIPIGLKINSNKQPPKPYTNSSPPPTIHSQTRTVETKKYIGSGALAEGDPTAGPRSPTSCTNVDSGGVAWINPGYCTTSDNNRATYAGQAAQPCNYGAACPPPWSDYLYASSFGFSITTGQIITGITVEVEKYRSGGSVYMEDPVLRLTKNGTMVGSNYGHHGNNCGYNWSTTEAYNTYGGSSDMWGTTWTVDEINNQLGVKMQACGGGNATAYVDHIRITVNYVAPTSTPTPTATATPTPTPESGFFMLFW